MPSSLTRTAAAAALGYLLGTIPSADVAARLASGGDVDLRAEGSGNPGATNAIAVLGKKWGYAVLAADVAKAAVACRAGRAVGGPTGEYAAGTAAVVGHCFPAWNGFRGGKGVACAGGQFATTFPGFIVPDAAAAALCMVGPREGRGERFIVIGTATAVVGAVVWWRKGWPNLWGPHPTVGLPIGAAVTSAVVLRKFATAKRLPR
jgi:glycerol-3-phosphate acyltransferase PlsY